MAAHDEQADLVRQATLVAVGISQGHAFVDGNTRTAYLVLEVFLELNGIALLGEPLELAEQLVAIANHRNDLDAATLAFEAWLRERVGPRSA